MPLTVPTDIPIIGADPSLQAELRSELSQIRASKTRRESTRVAISDEEKNQRQTARYDVSLPAVCYPVTPSNEADRSALLNAVVADINETGLMLLLDAAQPYVGLDLLIGIECPGGTVQFCSGSIVASKRNSRSLTEANLRFGGYLHELLQSEIVLPVLNRANMKFQHVYSQRTLASLCNVGALAAEDLDYLMVCPYCQAIPTLRNGCCLCLSSNVKSTEMIHHFACANVDFIDQFETDDGLCCQKCRTRNMIIGADYEYLDGPQKCGDCGKSNLETIQIGHCLNCENRFPMESASRLEIVGYRVNQLDPLALIGSA